MYFCSYANQHNTSDIPKNYERKEPKLKKTQTKAFANFICSILLLAFEIWAYIQTLGFRKIKGAYVQAATFPQVMIGGMILFTVILFIQSVIKLVKPVNANDPDMQAAPNMNPITNKGVLAGLIVIIICILYVALFDKLGYVLVSTITSIIIMWMIGKRNPVTVILVSVLVPLLMWVVFYKFLAVNIPMGILSPIKDMIDMI